MNKLISNKAFSLLEILLSAVIFIITIGGIFATLNAVRAPVPNKENALSAAVFGKQVLEALRSQVADPQTQAALKSYYNCSVASNPCPDFALSVGQHQVSAGTLSTFGITWPAALAAKNPNGLTYNVTCADGNPADCTTDKDIAHKVDLTIIW